MVEENEKFEEKKVVSADEHSEHMNLVGIAGGGTSSDSSITRSAVAGAAAGAALGRTLPDLQISGTTAATAGDRSTIPVGDRVASTVAEGIVNQAQNAERNNRIAAKAYGVVKDELVQLPQAMQDKFFSMDRNKDGSLSQEQLKFIKDNLSKDAYGAAQVFNDATRNQNGADGKLEGKKIQANDQNEGRSRDAQSQGGMKLQIAEFRFQNSICRIQMPMPLKASAHFQSEICNLKSAS